MSDISPREFGKLEEQVSTLVVQLNKQYKLIENMDSRMQEIENTLAEAKGGWKAFMYVSGVSGSVGAFITWLATQFTFRGPH